MTWDEAIEVLEKKRLRTLVGGGQKKIEQQHSRGKLLARERIDLLLDKDSFVELDRYIESRINDFDLDQRRVPGDGVVTGCGTIDGRLVFVTSEDFTVIGGTLGEYHSLKICRTLDMAVEMKAPIICINDSGGARIEEGISSLNGYSGIFLRHTRASGLIPQIAVTLGPCSGGACYAPAICDFIFMVKGISKMFITGPGVVKSVIGEDVSPDDLGGTDIHAQKSGVAHFIYDTEATCLQGVRHLLSYLPNSSEGNPSPPTRDVPQKHHFPLWDKLKSLAEHPVKQIDRSDRIQAIVPAQSRTPYDVLKVIDCIVDEGSFLQIQKDFAKNVVIGLGRMEDQVVAIVANQPHELGGALDCHASDKIARFVRFCDCFNVPLISLIDVPAFLPGTNQEHSGIIRHGAKILYAYCEATVPKISLIMRKAYGGAYIAMNSKDMGADIVYAWPTAEIAVMGAEGAVDIAFKHQINNADNPEETRKKYIAEYEWRFLNPYIAAARGYVSEVIRPDETRRYLLKALFLLKDKSVDPIKKKHGNIPL